VGEGKEVAVTSLGKRAIPNYERINGRAETELTQGRSPTVRALVKNRRPFLHLGLLELVLEAIDFLLEGRDLILLLLELVEDERKALTVGQMLHGDFRPGVDGLLKAGEEGPVKLWTWHEPQYHLDT